MDVWSWICELPDSENWSTGNDDSSLIYNLATSIANSDQLIQFKAEKKLEPNSETNSSLVFSVCLVGFHDTSPQEEVNIWVSDTCHLTSNKPFLPLILQLLQEIISRSPTAHDSSCPRSQLQKLQVDLISWILDSHSLESFSSFFNFIFVTRLFWMFVFDAPPVVGSLYFHSLLAPNLEIFSCKHAPVLRTFFISVGTDVELCFMRMFGYMLAKWLILREVGGVGVGLKTLMPLASHYLRFYYTTEAHGLWILKGYAPVKAMQPTRMNDNNILFPVIELKETALKYTLAHQQLEAVIQFEYTVGFYDGFIQVRARLDNIRLGIARLGFSKNEDEENSYLQEKHFPSRIRVWVGPEVGANYVGGLSLVRSTNNVEREYEMQRVLKGNFGNPKQREVKARAKMATKTKMKNWRWDQEAEENAAVYEAILYDYVSGCEISTWNPSNRCDDKNNQLMENFRGRYFGGNRAFTKKGGLVFVGEECGEEVVWRLNKEMEGSVLKWRVGGQVWLSYWPNNVRSSYYEKRLVEWCDEVDLPLTCKGRGIIPESSYFLCLHTQYNPPYCHLQVLHF